MTKNFNSNNNRNNSTTSNGIQPIHVIRGTYILKQFMNIYLNELQGKEPLDLSDVTIPWEKEEDVPGEDEIFPFNEVDAVALAENKAGKEFKVGIKTDPTNYVEALVDKYYSDDVMAQFQFFVWYQKMLELAVNDNKDSDPPLPEELTVNLFNPVMLETLGANRSQKLPDNFKKFKKHLPFKPRSCYEFNAETGAELVKHCLIQLFYLYNSIMQSYYISTRKVFAEEEKNGNTVNTAA